MHLKIMPPTTIDNIPLRRKTFGKGFENMGDADIRAMIRRIRGGTMTEGDEKAAVRGEEELAMRG